MGALIIKYVEGKNDRGTIEVIQENPYMQYFLGLDYYTDQPLFDFSLFVYIRKRLGNAEFDEMNQAIISMALNINDKDDSKKKQDDEQSTENDNQSTKNKGKLQLDATVADVNIKFPTDLNLLNESREKAEELIDTFCNELNISKPRTYRRVVRKEYLNVAKKKGRPKKSYAKQLNFLKRVLKIIDETVDDNPLVLCFLSPF